MDKAFRFMLMEEEVRHEKLDKAIAAWKMSEDPDSLDTFQIILEEYGIDFWSLSREEVTYVLNAKGELCEEY